VKRPETPLNCTAVNKASEKGIGHCSRVDIQELAHIVTANRNAEEFNHCLIQRFAWVEVHRQCLRTFKVALLQNEAFYGLRHTFSRQLHLQTSDYKRCGSVEKLRRKFVARLAPVLGVE
jgi:hypothetical protein